MRSTYPILLLFLWAFSLALHGEARIVGPLNALLNSPERNGVERALQRYSVVPRPGMVKRRRAEPISVICVPAKGISARAIKPSSVEKYGGAIDAVSDSYLRVSIIPDRLELLEQHPGFRAIRLPYDLIEQGGLGTYVSESVELIHALEFHEQGVRGSGIKVAVIDGGFGTLTEKVQSGELPQETYHKDFSGEGIEGGGDHGIAVAEQVMDIAPDAELHCLKIKDIVDLENAAGYLRLNNIPVVNMSLSWQGASYFDDTGPFATLVNESYDNDGVFWVTAAGNKGNSHWRGLWEDADANDKLDFDSLSNRLRAIEPYETVSVYLNWDQYGKRFLTDLDLYVIDENDSLIAFSSTNQRFSATPLEHVQFYSTTKKEYYILVDLVEGNAEGLDITVFVNQAGLDPVIRASSIAEPACAHGSFTVTAIGRPNWHSSSPEVHKYCGEGPTTDGRLKPEISAPDGTTSESFGEFGSWGTSFAAPVAAGAAVLLLDIDGALTAAGIRQQLIDMAVDIGVDGNDPVFGAGKLYIDPSLVNAPPRIRITGDTIVSESGKLDITVTAQGAHAVTSDILISGKPDNAIFSDNSNGYGTLAWETSYADAGDYAVTFSLRYNSQITTERTVAITIDNTPVPPKITTQGRLARNASDSLKWGWDNDEIDPDLDTSTMTFQIQMFTDQELTVKVVDQDSISGYSILSTAIEGFDTLGAGDIWVRVKASDNRGYSTGFGPSTKLSVESGITPITHSLVFAHNAPEKVTIHLYDLRGVCRAEMSVSTDRITAPADIGFFLRSKRHGLPAGQYFARGSTGDVTVENYYIGLW
ncbi:MAG: S8 family serine peptidase [Chitinivibrionales bacterium]|nr:S8 family serine peptidase [Chitinivibrionales bacterium]